MNDPQGATEQQVVRHGPWRVVIADDSSEMRALLTHTLDVDRRFEVVAGTGSALETLAVVEAQLPDVVVVDPALGRESSAALVPAILQASPASKVVVLMGYDSPLSPGDAMASGAHAFLDKGVPHSELLSVLAALCADDRSAHAAARSTGAIDAPRGAGTDGAGEDLAEARTPVADAEASMRRARWAAAVFALVQFSLYQPPDGASVPFALIPVGIVVAGIAVIVNLATGVLTKGADMERVHRIGIVELVIDTALVWGVVGAFTFDRTSALWALLVIPVLEGALRLQMRGAVATWGACSVAYLAREWWGRDAYGHPFEIESVTYRVGILAIVAVTVGQLAQRLMQQVDVAHDARHDATRRAGLLGVVASSSRRIISLGAGDVVPLVVSSASELGFDAALICVFDESAGTWSVRSVLGLPANDSVQPIEAGIAGLVHQRRSTVMIDDYAAWEGALDAGKELRLRAVVGVPIWSGGELRGTLLAGKQCDERITASEVESLELLAAQAGVAFGNVRLLEQIRHQALHDALTGLPNQSLFEDRANQAIARAARDGLHLAVLFLDLDRFKKVNDTLGHDAGNELLKQAAGRLLTAVRPSDTVARMGGDEFTVLLTGVVATADVMAAADRILEQFRKPFVLGGLELVVTPSIGIATHPEVGAYDQMLRCSDIAMYRAKQRGGNTYQVYSPALERSTQELLSLEAELFNAFESGELRVLYQPVFELTSRRIVGVEALVRWQHRSHGLLAPDDFLPLAEEAGLIDRIDAWVLERALEQASDWQRRGLPPIRVAANVSARRFLQIGAIATITEVIDASGFDPRLIDLEVTEALAVEDILDAVPLLERLRERGVHIVIDDFGTGYSMLTRLRQLPLDTLKIDKSFVQEIADGNDAPLVTATIAMAHSLGLRVVAEGIEREEQLELLLAHGCDLGQGFLFAPALTADELEARLRQGAASY